MATLPMTLEQTVSQHGDTLYRIALLLTDNEGRSKQALRQAVQRTAQEGTGELPGLIRALLDTLDWQRQRKGWLNRPGRSRRFFVDGPLYRGVGAPSPFALLSFEQRRILALHLLLGYDPPRLAQVLAVNEEQASDDLAAALTALATVAEIRLPSAVSSDECAPVRTLLMRDPNRLVTNALLRTHLPLCSLCRAFDAAWSGLSQQAETALRNGLRTYTIPRDLAAALAGIVDAAGQKRSWFEELLAGGRTSFIAIPLIVLLLIGALVLPGFLGISSQTSSGAALPPAEGRALVQKALALIDQPPAGEGVWHARWKTLWYFPNGSYAPINMEAWFDPANPARHRLQTVHSGGGALYELQVGDGENELWYAIGSTYYTSVYGNLGWTPPEPQLVRRAMDRAAQEKAAKARLRSGIWSIGPAYLQEAYNAANLRTLGRQPLGDHTVQIVSFVAPSPLGFPRDDPQALPVTILLGLDIADGRLRSVTELSGPAGGEQTTRVTWLLESEEWVNTKGLAQQIFDARAWNGRGRFPPSAEGTSVDSNLLLYDEQQQGSLEQLFASTVLAPATTPPGSERLHIQQISQGTSPVSYTLSYLGQQRQLFLTWRVVSNAEALEPVGPNLAQITPALNQRYHAVVASEQVRSQPTIGVVIDAQGFSRAELTQFIGELQPLNLKGWQQQQSLISSPGNSNHPIRQALVAAVGQQLRLRQGQAIYRRERVFVRQSTPSSVLPDPYHAQPEDYPATVIREQWIVERQAGGTSGSSIARFNRLTTDKGVHAYQYKDVREEWTFYPSIKLLEQWRSAPVNEPAWFSERAQAAYRFLASPDASATVHEQDGSRIFSMTTPFLQSVFAIAEPDRWRERPFLSTNSPPILTELLLDRENRPIALRYSAIENDGTVLLASWELEEERQVSIDAIPGELQTGTAPVGLANLVNDYNNPPWPLPTRTATITEAIATARSTLYLFPSSSSATLGQVEVQGDESASTTNPIGGSINEVARGLAVRFTYYVNGDWRQSLQITQGPAGPLGTYLRTQSAKWVASKPIRLVIAGRDVEGWMLQGPPFTSNRVVVELDDTLIIAEASDRWFETTALPLLATLEPVSDISEPAANR